MKDRLRTMRPGLLAMVAVVAAVTGLAASAQAAPGAAARLSVRSTEYGKAIFGPSGKVVYVFGADRGSTSRCYGVCATAWPPLLTSAKPLAGTGVQAKLLGTTKRKDGTLQVTYNGHPLYRYAGDSKPGDTTGQGLKQFGAEWYVLAASGDKIDNG